MCGPVTAPSYGLECPWIECRWGRDFPQPPRRSLEPTHLHIPRGYSGRGVKLATHPLTSAEVNDNSYTSSTPLGLLWRVIERTELPGTSEGRTESHEQLFFYANWEQQTKKSAVVDGTSCCVILECLVRSIACIT